MTRIICYTIKQQEELIEYLKLEGYFFYREKMNVVITGNPLKGLTKKIKNI